MNIARLRILLALVALCACALGQSIPQLTADSLDGRKVSLPSDFAGKSAILIIGFSRAAGDQCGPFARKLAKEHQGVVKGDLLVYQIAMLESAPKLVRPLILHGMRSGVPNAEQPNFLPLFHGEEEWKLLAGFTKSAANDSYLLLVSPDGTIRWAGHGQFSDARYSEFKQHLH